MDSKNVKTEAEKTPPQDLDAEESVLGAVLLDDKSLNRVPFLEHRDFYREKHVRIFQAMRSLARKNEPVDLVTLGAELKARNELEAVGGQTYLAHLASRAPSAAHIKTYGEIVHEKALIRGLLREVTGLIEEGYTPGAKIESLLERAEAAILGIRRGRVDGRIYSAPQAVRAAMDALDKILDAEKKGSTYGLPWGFEKLDALLGRLWPGTLTTIAARPGVGKSAFAWNVTLRVADKHPVLFVSCEMSPEALIWRGVAALDGEQLSAIRRAVPRQSALAKFHDIAALKFEIAKFRNPRFEDIANAAKLLKSRNPEGFGLVVVDYLQITARGAENRHEFLGEMTAGLKFLSEAEGLNWPIIQLSQLNREAAKDGEEPELWHLRESGSIEEDSDTVAFLVPKFDNKQLDAGTVDFIVRKQRDGRLGRCSLWYDGPTTCFHDNKPEEGPEQGKLGV